MRIPYQACRPHSGEACENAKWAFSLIELLVVISVIGVLAALILTGIVAAKKKVQQAQCAHNVGQLGLGIQVFVTDNHVYPLDVNPNYFKGAYLEHHTAWITALQGVLARGDPVHPNSTNLNDKGERWHGTSKKPTLYYATAMLKRLR